MFDPFSAIPFVVDQVNLTNSSLQNNRSDFQEVSDPRMYLLGVYYVVATIATVGYGDISAVTYLEKAAMSVFIILGVMVYTNAIGLFSSVLVNPQ